MKKILPILLIAALAAAAAAQPPQIILASLPRRAAVKPQGQSSAKAAAFAQPSPEMAATMDETANYNYFQMVAAEQPAPKAKRRKSSSKPALRRLNAPPQRPVNP